MNDGLREALRLSAKITRESPESMRIAWELENTSDVEIVALRHLFRAYDKDGRLQVERDLAYITVEDDGTVHASKKLLPLPRGGIQVFMPIVPLGEIVPPGATIRDKLVLRRPISPYDPYQAIVWSALGPPLATKVEATRLFFHLGVYVPAPSVTSAPIQTALGELRYPHYEQVLGAQIVLDAPPLPLAGEALRAGPLNPAST